MKKLFLGICALALFSCQNEDVFVPEDVTPLQTKSMSMQDEFSVVDGCLVFDNMDVYNFVYQSLKDKTKDELLEWSKNNNYVSLLESYQAEEEDDTTEENQVVKTNQMSDNIEASFFNSEGLLYVADTIYKVIDENVYKLHINDSELLSDLVENPDKYKNNSYKHTEYLVLKDKTRSSVEDGERSYMIDVDSKRREYVKFFVSKSTDVSGMMMLNLKMQGQAQKKGPLGRWKLPFDDEMVWGQIFLDGVLISNSVAKGPFSSQKVLNQKEVSMQIPLTAANQVSALKVKMTWKFCKNTIKGDEVYEHEYLNP